jgi:hypothetical protein
VIADVPLLEPGLWSVLPEEVFRMELRLAEKQGADFHLRAPDEPQARAAFEAAHPDRVQQREARIAELRPRELFSADDEEDATEGDAAEEIGEDEPESQEIPEEC